jgi:hypothetical protein
VPKTVKRALQKDEETKTTFWRDALKKEMGGMAPIIDILPDGLKPPVGYQQYHCMLFLMLKCTSPARLA